ncbi:uncharacterized protein LOC125673701 [Ostrea edulis]|uniref:uncharacterized protein LOC125673701 n=1 Tax=Ostrea edulis TaxID=37623 RepID=UPI002094B0D8|nr:uncharacterized protein LOC125673701 [Ostrea edulis]
MTSDFDKYLLVGVIVGSTMLVICTWLIVDFCMFHREKVNHRKKKTGLFYSKKTKRLQMHHASIYLPAPAPDDPPQENSSDPSSKSPRCLSPIQRSSSPSAANTLSPLQNKIKKKLRTQAKGGHSPRNLQKKSSNEKGSFKLSDTEESELFPVINDGSVPEKESL